MSCMLYARAILSTNTIYYAHTALKYLFTQIYEILLLCGHFSRLNNILAIKNSMNHDYVYYMAICKKTITDHAAVNSCNIVYMCKQPVPFAFHSQIVRSGTYE